MGQKVPKQEKLKKLDRDTKTLGDDQIVWIARIRSTRDSFHLGISWFKKQKSVPYVEKNLQRRHEYKPVSSTKLACKRYAANFLMNFLQTPKP